RPDDRPGFLARRSGAHRIELQELSLAETARVLENLVGGLQLPASLEGRILSVADGNPLFAEQMISMLIDSGVIWDRGGGWEFAGGDDDVTVPPKISSLLASRLAPPSPPARGSLWAGAVVRPGVRAPPVSALAPHWEAGSGRGSSALLCRECGASA